MQAGETIGAIAARMAGEGVTREQAIVALFRANPGAFIANNLNLVREGAVLRVPAREEMAGVELRESRALLREQIAAWREMTQPAPQPEAGLAAGPGAAGHAYGRRRHPTRPQRPSVASRHASAPRRSNRARVPIAT